MTKSAVSVVDAGPTIAREPRPFLYLEPARLPLRSVEIDAGSLARLDEAVGPSVPALVRSLVDYTIARQNRSALERGNASPIQLSVLNRRRRAARSWIVAILAGRVDSGTLHAVSSQWIPTLAGTGHDLRKSARPGRNFIEFVRGAITACIFDECEENLVPSAKAAWAVETVLGAHLGAVQQAARVAFAK